MSMSPAGKETTSLEPSAGQAEAQAGRGGSTAEPNSTA